MQGVSSSIIALKQLDLARRIEDLRAPPANHLEQLKSDRAGQWSLRVNDQFRTCSRQNSGLQKPLMIEWEMAMPAAQRNLFDEPGAVPSVRIESANKALSKNQRLFNQLAERLRALRAELTSWQHALDRYRSRAAAEIEPLQRELRAEQRAAVLFMDGLLGSTAKGDRMTRTRRAKLRSIVVALAETVLRSGPDGEVEAVFHRHSGMRHRDLLQAELDMAEAMFGRMLGEDIVAGHEAKNVDELIEHAGERLHAKFEARAEKRRQRTETRRARREGSKPADAARGASQSVRDVFRRLVAALHPDREPDAAERERKTALMQRVNQAYERNDLLELLTVQIEIRSRPFCSRQPLRRLSPAGARERPGGPEPTL